mgnify:CR=1 FL=1
MLGFEEGSKREWEVLRNSNRSGNWESVDRELEEGGVGGDSVAERGEGGGSLSPVDNRSNKSLSMKSVESNDLL